MRVVAGAAIASLMACACSAIAVGVPKKKPPPPNVLDCSYKLPIIDSVFAVGFVGGAVIGYHEGAPGALDMRPVLAVAFGAFAFIAALSATYGFVEERRCYRLPDPD
jgi:hypothetical protein